MPRPLAWLLPFLASPLRESVMLSALQDGHSPQEAFAAALVMGGVSYMLGLYASALVREWRCHRPKL